MDAQRDHEGRPEEAGELGEQELEQASGGAGRTDLSNLTIAKEIDKAT